MTRAEWATFQWSQISAQGYGIIRELMWTIREGNQRGITPHTWANWREKEPDEATSVSKENLRKHPLQQGKIFMKVKPHMIKIWTFLAASS